MQDVIDEFTTKSVAVPGENHSFALMSFFVEDTANFTIIRDY
jgi:hypothetical protein